MDFFGSIYYVSITLLIADNILEGMSAELLINLKAVHYYDIFGTISDIFGIRYRMGSLFYFHMMS